MNANWDTNDGEAWFTFGQMLILAGLWSIALFWLPLALLIWWLA